MLRGGNDLKFRAPDLHNKRLREQIISEGITSVEAAQASVYLVSVSEIVMQIITSPVESAKRCDTPKHRFMECLIAIPLFAGHWCCCG